MSSDLGAIDILAHIRFSGGITSAAIVSNLEISIDQFCELIHPLSKSGKVKLVAREAGFVWLATRNGAAGNKQIK